MRAILAGLFAVTFASAALAQGAQAGPYAVTRHIKIGGEGGWDYLKVDHATNRLYVSHGTKIVVIDLEHENIVGEVANLSGVHGAIIAPEAGRGFTSNGRDTSVTIFDA